MNIINNEFRSKIIKALEDNGFEIDQMSKWQILYHANISGFRVQYKEYHNHIKVEIYGNTISSPRNIEYDDTDLKSSNRLKTRLSRIVKKEIEDFSSRDKRVKNNRDKKKMMDHKIRNFNHNKGGHSIVVDPESLEDEYGSLSVYYRSHEFNVNLNENGDVYTTQSMLNQPSKQLTMDQLCKIADVLINDFI